MLAFIVFWVFSVCGLCLTPHTASATPEDWAFTSAYTWIGGFFTALLYLFPQMMWRGMKFYSKKGKKNAEP